MRNNTWWHNLVHSLPQQNAYSSFIRSHKKGTFFHCLDLKRLPWGTFFLSYSLTVWFNQYHCGDFTKCHLGQYLKRRLKMFINLKWFAFVLSRALEDIYIKYYKSFTKHCFFSFIHTEHCIVIHVYIWNTIYTMGHAHNNSTSVLVKPLRADTGNDLLCSQPKI